MKLELPSKFIYVTSYYDISIEPPGLTQSKNKIKRVLIRYREIGLTYLLQELWNYILDLTISKTIIFGLQRQNMIGPVITL